MKIRDCACRLHIALYSCIAISIAVVPCLGHTKEPELGSTLTTEIGDKKMYRFIVRPYRDEVVFSPSRYKPGEIDVYSEPDIIAIKLLTLKAHGEIHEYYSYFADEYKDAEYKRLGFADDDIREDLAERWRKTWSEILINLTHRVDFNIRVKRHAVIGYELIGGGNKETGEFAFRRHFDGKGFKWRVVDLSDHVVVKNWRFHGTEKVLRNERIYGQDGRCEWATESPCKEYPEQ